MAMSKAHRRIGQALLAVAGIWLPALAPAAVLTGLQFTPSQADGVAVELEFFGDVPSVRSYRLDDPPRLAFDLPDTESGLGKRRFDVNRGGVERITAVEAGGRVRLVMTTDEALPYTARPGRDDSHLRLVPDSDAGSAPDAARSTEPDAGTRADTVSDTAPGTVSKTVSRTDAPGALATAGEDQVDDIDFRRGENGAGRLEVTFNHEGSAPRVSKKAADRVVLDLGPAALPDALNQIYDVTDFATPVQRIVPRVDAQGTRLELVTDGAYAMMSSQDGRTYSVTVEPVDGPDESGEGADSGASEPAYTGKRLSLNFQDIEIRSVLSTLADFTGLNLVASDSVSGRVTLNLNDVPWDQALDLILQSQGLASRQQGNVIVVAPAGELAELERRKLEARSQQETLTPLVTRYFDVKYARAKDLAQLLNGEDGFGLLTDRGRVSVDERTNTLLLQDTAEQVDEVISTLERLDVAVRQVQIEARIVIARDTASRELGINWGLSSTGEGNLDLGGVSDGTTDSGGLSVDMGASGNQSTTFGFGYLSGDILLDLELQALESEGKSQTISQPRIITANQRTATISQGEERAYQSVDGNDNPDTEFKEALLSLEVTPQITPDDRIIMDLVIRNDSFRESGFDGEPPIDTNTIETQVLADNGQTVVLGGILTTEELRRISKTPLLGDLPVVGNLFRYTEESNEKVELLVFITPRLLDDGPAVR